MQINTYIPFALELFIDIHSSLTDSMDALLDKFFSGMKVDPSRMIKNLYGSNAILNTLRPVLGYSIIKNLSFMIEKNSPSSVEELLDIIVSFTGIEREYAQKWLSRENLTSYSMQFPEKTGPIIKVEDGGKN